MNLKLRLIKGLGVIVASREPDPKLLSLAEQIAQATEDLQHAEAAYNECHTSCEEICFYWMKMQEARRNLLLREARKVG